MNGPPHSALVVPEPLDEDDDDIRWALHTAAVQWRRGAREDAVAWVRRGADAAVDGGFWERASQLNVAAASLENALRGSGAPGPASSPAAFSAPAASHAPTVSSLPKAPPRLPTPTVRSALPQPPRSGPPSQPPPPSVKPAHLSRPPSVRVPTLSSSPVNSRWPTGFPKGPPPTATPSGQAIAPPPPLPAGLKKAPIPPPPKAKSRDANRDEVEIEISEESIDLSDEELAAGDLGYGTRGEFTKPSVSSLPPNSVPSAGFNALPSYQLDEDPSDGTTSLPLEPPYGSSLPPDSFDEQGLPAFPLEESIPPAGPLSSPRAPASVRQNASPQFASPRSIEPSSPRRAASVAQRPLTSQRAPSAPVSEAAGRSRARVVSEEPTIPGYHASFSDEDESDLDGDSLLKPFSRRASAKPTEDTAASNAQSAPRSTFPTRDDLLEPLDEDASSPPSTARGLGQLGSGPPDALNSEPRQEPGSSQLPKRSSTRPPPSRGISVPSPASIQPPRKSRPTTTQRLSTSVPAERATSERSSARDIQSELPPVPPLSELPVPDSASEVIEEAPASAAPSLYGIAFADVRGLCDLPEDAQKLLRKRARIERMGTGEDLSFFSVVLVLEGWVKLMPAIADVTCATASAGDVVFTEGTLQDGVALRVVAGQNGTTLATWDKASFSEITAACPWVGDELRLIADSFQALAGATLGPLGERLDDALREVVTSRCRVLTLLPHEVLVARGKPVPGMHIVGGGTIELIDEHDNVVGTCAPGDFLLTAQVLAGGVTPHTARAAESGALVLFAPRMDAHELLVSVPPLLEILAG